MDPGNYFYLLRPFACVSDNFWGFWIQFMVYFCLVTQLMSQIHFRPTPNHGVDGCPRCNGQLPSSVNMVWLSLEIFICFVFPLIAHSGAPEDIPDTLRMGARNPIAPPVPVLRIPTGGDGMSLQYYGV